VAGVREATEAEAPVLARRLRDAFRDDPVQRWLFPHPAAYEARGLANFELTLRRMLEVGLVHTTAGLEGAALWLPPGRDLLERPGGSRFGLRSVLALRGAIVRGARFFAALARHHPRGPHWYLPVLGTAPEYQGRGVASALLRALLARSDAEGLPAYLESSKERNLPFYRSHGFEVQGTVCAPGGPTVWPMLRAPRPGAGGAA
jgi:ribosomal protein S18 acetylase RimI-like enzyme